MDNGSHGVLTVAPGRLKGIRLSILSDEDSEKIAETVIGSVNEVSGAALGLPSLNATECSSCGGRNSKECEGHFGLIHFPYTILNPYFMLEVAQILNKICIGCKSVRRSEAKNLGASLKQQSKECKYCIGSTKSGYPKMRFKVSSKEVFAKTAIIAEVSSTVTEKSLAKDFWDIIPKDSAAEHSGLPLNIRVLSPVQVYGILKEVCPKTLESLLKRKSKIFLNSIIVTPNSHRVREFGQRITVDETTKMYRKLIDFRGTPNELSARVIERYRVSKIRPEKVSSWQKAYEKQSTNENASSASGLRNIKDLLLGKRTDNCFRMVVVGDPKIRVDEIGIPFHIAESVHIKDNINSWNWDKLEPCCDFMLYQRGCFSVLRNGERILIWSKDMLRTGDSVYRPLIDGDILLINRPPSIHQHSLIALRVKTLPVKCVLSINPLICHPLRGDFDGDCLHGYVPQSINTRVELNELVSLNKQLTNMQNGRNLLLLGQDSLSAAHLVLEDGILLKKSEMQQLQMFTSCAPVLPAIISGTSYWTGKQLFNLLLPPDFEYTSMSNGVCITRGELVSSSRGSSWLHDTAGNLIQCLIRHCGDGAIEFLNSGQELLCEWLTRRGLSVSLSDLYLSSGPDARKNLLEDISYALRKAEELSDVSLLMVNGNQDFLVEHSEDNTKMENFLKEQMSIFRQTKAELFQASMSAAKSVLRDMQSLVYRCSAKNNSLIAMLNAGSKGNLLKLVQHSLCVGLQHSLAPVSFSMPRELSCAAWNRNKNSSNLNSSCRLPNSYIPCNIIASSFLSGLNPLECFVLSLTTRDGSFGGNADVSGTLTRKLMFFMRDLIAGYDGTVRSSYGNQVVQFNYYNTEKMAESYSDMAMGGHPVGALAACAISEAAYSALDQPVSVLEPSPLLTLKSVMECGMKRNSGHKSVSLYLSKKLGKLISGFEYGALEVKNYLESLVFSDVVSDVKICFSNSENDSSEVGRWVCHFHISKDVVKKRRLRIQSVIDALLQNNKFSGSKLKANLPLHITSIKCSEMDACKKSIPTICISVELIKSFEEFSDLEFLRDVAAPVLLQTIVKGFPEFKKVDILWKDKPNQQKNRYQPTGELYLRVVKSEHCDGMKFWSIVVDKCLKIRNLIDWERSHPDSIGDCSEVFGLDSAWQYFVNSLHSAISDTGKTILPEHLIVTANCLSATGEFVPLTSKGFAYQRKETNSYSPLTQACFSNPSDVLAKAAKLGQRDALQGSLEALSWGQTPSVGTGYQFEIVYSGKGHISSKPMNVYEVLRPHVRSTKPNGTDKPITSLYNVNKKGHPLLKAMMSQSQGFSAVGIQKLSQKLKRMLKEFPINRVLSGDDKSVALRALQFHPQWEKKIGTGILDIKVGRHPDHKESCFFIVRTDGTEEDFSYNKCIHHALEIIAPERAKAYRSKRENAARAGANG